MDEKQIESALEKIAMNESLTDELADDEAELLLQWGETQVRRLADQITEMESFDEAIHTLSKLMSGINGFIGLRGDMDADEQQAGLHKIVEAARGIGYTTFTPEHIVEFLQHSASEDNCENMNFLTAWINAHGATADDEPVMDDAVAVDDDAADGTVPPVEPDTDSASSLDDFSFDPYAN